MKNGSHCSFLLFYLCALQVGRGQEVACYLSYMGHHCWGVGVNSISEPKGFPPCSVKHRIGSRILTEEEMHGLEQGFLNLSIHQNHLESLLKQMTGPCFWSFLTQWVWGGPENVHFWQFPGWCIYSTPPPPRDQTLKANGLRKKHSHWSQIKLEYCLGHWHWSLTTDLGQVNFAQPHLQNNGNIPCTGL